MIVSQSHLDLRSHLLKSNQPFSIGFVPTMGAIHQGHLALVEQSKRDNGKTIVSVFVNPTQFAQGEDFEKYPRTLENDLRLLEAAGVDIAFTPQKIDMYPHGFSFSVEETKISRVMCGAFRPGHFSGVCTIVLKLLNIVAPDKLYLGQKDAQQVRVIQKMVQEFNLQTTIVNCPTVREPSGLAMSSRNRYLTPQEHRVAPRFYQALENGKKAFAQGMTKSRDILNITRETLNQTPEFKLQYLELRSWETFEEVDVVEDVCILAGALFLGETRLIDNVFLDSEHS